MKQQECTFAHSLDEVHLHMVGGFELMKFTVVVNEGETCEIHVSDKIWVLFASGGCGV